MCINAVTSKRPSAQPRSSSGFNPVETVASEFYSLLDEVDSESIAEEFRIATHSKKHDFDNHLKVGIFKGVNPSDSLAELTKGTATHDQLLSMVDSTFSRRTNDRDYRAVVRVLFELLHTPQLLTCRSTQASQLAQPRCR